MKTSFYLQANASNGYITHADRRMAEYENIFVLSFAKPFFKSELMKSLENFLKSFNLDYDVALEAGSESIFNSIFIPQKQVCITDTFPQNFIFGQNIKLFNLSKLYNCDALRKKTPEIKDISDNIASEKEKMFSILSEAKKIHDDWEKIYIENMNFEKLDKIFKALKSRIFASSYSSETPPADDKRFFGSMLHNGNINFIDELTEGIEKRIFIKGRPGSGKSTLMKKIRTEAHNRNYSTQTYYCSFDSNSIDMVVIPELSFCIFDSTAPHEMFPTRETDEICDIYSLAIAPKTDERFFEKLTNIKDAYNLKIANAKACLKSISEKNEKLNALYSESADKNQLTFFLNEIYSEIVSL